MNIKTVSVSVKKMLSDSNYGHESAEVSYTAEIEEHDDVMDATNQLLARATAHVRVQLLESETLNIRRAINPRPRRCSYCQTPLGDWDNYSHKACEEEQRAERDRKRAEQNAEWERQNAALDAAGLKPLNMHDSGEDVLDGSDLSDQEVEWMPGDHLSDVTEEQLAEAIVSDGGGGRLPQGLSDAAE